MGKKQYVINQHYVPKYILKFFKESNEIYNNKKKRIYHVLHQKKNVYPSTIDRVMSGEYFYEHPNFATNEIEDQFKRYETIYSKIHGQLFSLICEYEKGREKFSQVKAKSFSLVEPIIRMHLRSGAMMFELKFWSHSLNNIYAMLYRFNNINYIKAFARVLTNFHGFCILKSSDNNFVISDQILTSAALSFKARFLNATNRTIGQKDVIVFLPISKIYYLCFFNGNKPNFVRPNQLRYLTPQQTEEVNKIIMNNSYLQTAGPSYNSLNSILNTYKQVFPKEIFYKTDKGRGAIELRKEVFFYEKDKEIFNFIEDAKYLEYKGIQKNDLCPCGSGKKFVECCRYKMRALQKFMKKKESFLIPKCNFLELNIFEYYQKLT